MEVNWTAIFLSAVPPVAVAIAFYATQQEVNKSQKELNKEIKERMTAIEKSSTELTQEFNATRVTSKYFMSMLEDLKKDIHGIYNKLDVVTEELKDIYRDKKK